MYCPLISKLITVLPPIPNFLNKSAMTVLTVKRKESHICWVFAQTEGSGVDLLPPWLPGSKIPTSAHSSGTLSGLWCSDWVPHPPFSTVKNYSLLYIFTYLSLGFWENGQFMYLVCTWSKTSLFIFFFFLSCNYGLLLGGSIKGYIIVIILSIWIQELV